MRWLRRQPILTQTLLLLVTTLLASAIANIVIILVMPEPRAEFYAMRDLTDALAQGRRAERLKGSHLQIRNDEVPPTPAGHDMISNVKLTERLADGLDVPVDRVRLIYEADQSNFPFSLGRTVVGVPIRLGEPEFYNIVIAALKISDGQWRVVTAPARPFPNRWQLRSIASFFFSFLVVLPLAILFARQIAFPIRRFADAASRVGEGPEGALVPVEGSVELRLAGQALNQTQIRLADILAERTAMTGAIAHDLRTPLARIAFRIQNAPAKMRDAVMADIEQMRAMIAATISYVTTGTKLGPRASVDLRAILGRLADEAREMNHDVQLSGLRGWILGDSVALLRMFQNIIDNAVSYGGSAQIAVMPRRDRIVVTVADRGPGLSKSMLEAVFKPFNRGEPSRSRSTGGVGLGLSIARSIAVAHEGSLVSQNREGGGLVIVAEFPAIAAPVRRFAREPAVA